MKWFKHLTASGSDPDIGELMDALGFEGYYLFFRTIEIMSIEFDINNPGQSSFSFKWFLDQFSRKITRKKLIAFLDITNKKKRILYSLNGTVIHLNCPKLKNLTDEYTRQKPYRVTEKVTAKVTSDSVTDDVTNVTPKIKDTRLKSIDIHKEIRHEVIQYLNEKADKHYHPDAKDTIGFINGRLNDEVNPATKEDLLRVIDIKVPQWIDDIENNKYLRPATLFNASKFEAYRNERKPEDDREVLIRKHKESLEAKRY